MYSWKYDPKINIGAQNIENGECWKLRDKEAYILYRKSDNRITYYIRYNFKTLPVLSNDI